VGIAKVVIKTRQHLAAVKPEEKALILEIMHFSEELVEPTGLNIPSTANIGAKELDMASELVNKMTGAWDPAKYTDDYRHALMDLIHKKIELGGKELPAAHGGKKQPTKVIDLVSVLQESLAHAGKGTKKKTKRPVHKQHLKKAA
jgi:DNA end-binding protein Ku